MCLTVMTVTPTRSQCDSHVNLISLQLVQNSMGGWGDFLGDMQRFYGVKLDCLNDEFRQEQQEYFMSTSAWADIHPSQLLGPPACFKHYDLLTVTLEEIAAPLQVWSFPPSTLCRHSAEHLCGVYPCCTARLVL